jgi:hypothetical protein
MVLRERYGLIALKDNKVQKHFLDHINKNEIFIEQKCVPASSGPLDELRIIFEFRCMPCICFIPPTFMVILNTSTSKVLEINDSYTGPVLRSKGKEASIATTYDEQVIRLKMTSPRRQSIRNTIPRDRRK